MKTRGKQLNARRSKIAWMMGNSLRHQRGETFRPPHRATTEQSSKRRDPWKISVNAARSQFITGHSTACDRRIPSRKPSSGSDNSAESRQPRAPVETTEPVLDVDRFVIARFR